MAFVSREYHQGKFTYFECVCSFNITGKWHLGEEYELKMISRLQASDRMVALSKGSRGKVAWRSLLGHVKWKESNLGLFSTQKITRKW